MDRSLNGLESGCAAHANPVRITAGVVGRGLRADSVYGRRWFPRGANWRAESWWRQGPGIGRTWAWLGVAILPATAAALELLVGLLDVVKGVRIAPLVRVVDEDEAPVGLSHLLPAGVGL